MQGKAEIEGKPEKPPRYMTKKLFAFAKGQCVAENADNPMFQEVLLAGHLYQKVLKEKIENWLMSVKTNMEREGKLGGQEYSADPVQLNSAMRRGQEEGRPMEFLMVTGNLISRTGLGLKQFINLRDVSHDRGQLSLIFGNRPGNKSTEDQLDADGLPFVGKGICSKEMSSTGQYYYMDNTMVAASVVISQYREIKGTPI